ncbi:MAG: hypothetical protein U5M51_05765 [Emticicia sp.]|nr:hypothetical protein [Emticicia sp.]
MNTKVQLITEDFQIFLSHLKSKKTFELTNAGAKIKTKDLLDLNEQSNHKALWINEKSTQKKFSMLNFFLYISIYGKLAKVFTNEKGVNTLIPSERLELFFQLNTSEQYCFILKTLWCDVNWEKINDDRGLWFIRDGISILTKAKINKVYSISNRHVSELKLYLMYKPYCEFFECMGWYELIPTKGVTKVGSYDLPYESITVSEFGAKIGQILEKERDWLTWNTRESLGSWDEDEETQVETKEEDFITPFKSLFDEPIDDILPLSPILFKGGRYVFRLDISKTAYRLIEIGGEATLLDLHEMIQDGLNFDNDHLFSFTIDEQEFTGAPYDFDSPEYIAQNVLIGNLDLEQGKKINYVFDFGDNWEFNLVVELLDETSAEPEPKVIKRVGKAPKQYHW